MGEAAESDSWLIDQAVAEYEAYCAGELQPSVRRCEAPDGELQYCGWQEDRSRWTVAYVRAEDRVVTPLAVGDFDHVRASFSRLDQMRARIEDPRLFPPPAARVGGALYRFTAVQGCSLVGAAQVGKAAVLLVAIGERVAVVYLEGKSRAVLDIKPPLGLREVDVDRMLGFRRPSSSSASASASAAESPVQPPAAVQAHHIRIVRGVPVDVGNGPAISEVLRSCFEDIVWRVRALKQPGKKLKGKTKLPKVLDALLRLALFGSGDLVGLSGEIIAEIKVHAPKFEITAEAFSDVLNLMRAAKTCLVARGSKDRTWRINLAGLGDPRSALHIRLCKETTGCARVSDGAANQRPGGGRRETGPRERATGTGPRAPASPAAHNEATASAPDATMRAGWPAIAGGDGDGERVEEADAARPVSKDSIPPSTGAAGEDAVSPMVLAAAMLVAVQVGVQAEQALITERAAWEAERQALLVQAASAAEDRAELAALREQLVEVTRPAQLLARVERAEVGAGKTPVEPCATADAGHRADGETRAESCATTGAGHRADGETRAESCETTDAGHRADGVTRAESCETTDGETRAEPCTMTDATAEAEPRAAAKKLAAAQPAELDRGLDVGEATSHADSEKAVEPKRADGSSPSSATAEASEHAALEAEPHLADHPGSARRSIGPSPATAEAPAELTADDFDEDLTTRVDLALLPGAQGLGSLGPRGPPGRRR